MSRYDVTIDHTKVSANLTNFPVFIRLDDIISGITTAQANSIRVYESDGTTEVAREVVSTNEMHFLATNVSATIDTVFIIDIDGIRSDYSKSATYGAENVWGDDYRLVSHDGGGTDSTSNGNDGTAFSVTVGGKTGVIGEATQFSGGRIDIMNNSSLEMENIHISFWGKTTETSTNYIIDKKGGTLGSIGDGGFMFGISSMSGTGLSFSLSNGTSASRLNSGSETEFRGSGEWAKIDLLYDGTTQDMYINGVFVSSQAGSNFLDYSTNQLRVGSGLTTSQPYIGYLDELRIMSSTKSADWIDAEHNNQLNPEAFYTVTESNGGGGDTTSGNMLLMF